MDINPHRIPHTIRAGKAHTMSNKNPNNSGDNSDDFEFEFVDANEISFVKRGRKPLADPELIKYLTNLPVGQALRIRKMQTDPKSANYATEKARISSQIRTACKAANLKTFRILWSPEGIPQVQC